MQLAGDNVAQVVILDNAHQMLLQLESVEEQRLSRILQHQRMLQHKLEVENPSQRRPDPASSPARDDLGKDTPARDTTTKDTSLAHQSPGRIQNILLLQLYVACVNMPYVKGSTTWYFTLFETQ